MKRIYATISNASTWVRNPLRCLGDITKYTFLIPREV